MECKKCNGSGKVEVPASLTSMKLVDCDLCEGTGISSGIRISTELARELCEIFGILFTGLRDIQINCRYDDAPILKIERIITIAEEKAIKTVIEKYELKKKED